MTSCSPCSSWSRAGRGAACTWGRGSRRGCRCQGWILSPPRCCCACSAGAPRSPSPGPSCRASCHPSHPRWSCLWSEQETLGIWSFGDKIVMKIIFTLYHFSLVSIYLSMYDLSAALPWRAGPRWGWGPPRRGRSRGRTWTAGCRGRSCPPPRSACSTSSRTAAPG